MIRDRVLIVWVEGEASESWIEVGEVRDRLVIQLDQQSGIRHDRNHVVGRDHQIVGCTSGFHLREHRLVGVVFGVGDFDVVLGFEFGQEVLNLGVLCRRAVRDVFGPVVEVQVPVGFPGFACVGRCLDITPVISATGGEHQGKGPRQGQESLHTVLPIIFWTRGIPDTPGM